MIEENVSLKKYNTFGIDATARYFARFTTIDELTDCLGFKQLSTINYQPTTLILGGGSNILFTQNFLYWIFGFYIPHARTFFKNIFCRWVIDQMICVCNTAVIIHGLFSIKFQQNKL